MTSIAPLQTYYGALQILIVLYCIVLHPRPNGVLEETK